MATQPIANLFRMAKDIQLWLVDKLIPYARNPRTHSDAQVAQIAASIAEFGFNNPILVDTKAGIIAGHGRLLAARKLGLTEVPVIVLDHLSEAQKRAYVIADNKLAENAGWDDDLLRIEIEALQDESFDVSLLGFEDVELALASMATTSTRARFISASRENSHRGPELICAFRGPTTSICLCSRTSRFPKIGRSISSCAWKPSTHSITLSSAAITRLPT